MSDLLWNQYSSYLEKKYGYRIWRVGIDAGFSCPNRSEDRKGGCVYCDSLGSTAVYQRTVAGLSLRKKSIKEQIADGKRFLQRRYKAEHFALYFQAFSNTFAPVDTLREIYNFALAEEEWEALIVSTRPDCIDAEKCELLSTYKKNLEVCIELGLQSGSDRILKEMNRGHSVSCFEKAVKLIKQTSLQLCIHIIVGFPKETEKEIEMTVNVINRSKPHFLKIHNLNIAKDTALYNNYLNGSANTLSVREYIERVSYILRRISPDIVIERLLCDTPKMRLVAPLDFPDKNTFVEMLHSYMKKNNFRQGDLYR